MGTFERVKNAIVDEVGIDEGLVTSIACLTDDLGLDSLDALSLIMNIEEAFSIEISDAEAEQFKTVGDIVTYIDRQ